MKYLDLLKEAENKNLTVVLIYGGRVAGKARFYRQAYVTNERHPQMYKITKRDYDSFIKAGADERKE